MRDFLIGFSFPIVIFSILATYVTLCMRFKVDMAMDAAGSATCIAIGVFVGVMIAIFNG